MYKFFHLLMIHLSLHIVLLLQMRTTEKENRMNHLVVVMRKKIVTVIMTATVTVVAAKENRMSHLLAVMRKKLVEIVTVEIVTVIMTATLNRIILIQKIFEVKRLVRMMSHSIPLWEKFAMIK